MMSKPVLSIVLPCRNQADHVGAVLPKYLAPLESLALPFELVIVPNASSDSTQAVVEKLALNDARLRVVPNPKGGWGLSVRTGLNAARGEILAYTNTARTDPDTLPQFVQLYLAHGPCLVKARREHRKSPLREIGSALYNLEGRMLFGIAARDVNGTPKVFARDLYEAASPSSDGDLLDMELMAQAARLGTRIIELPVQGFKRHGGKSSTTPSSAWKMYKGALSLWLTLRRAA